MQEKDHQESIFKPALKINTMHENNIRHIRYLIRLIESYNLLESFDVLYNHVGNLLNQVPAMLLALRLPNHPFDPANPGDFIGCIRTRKVKSLNEIKCDDDLWARPKRDVDYFGRCHSPNQEVLYCSSSLGITLYELDLRKDDLIVAIRYISKNPNKSLDFIVLGDERYNFEDNEIVNSEKIESIYTGLSKKNREKLRTIEKFILRSFRKKVGPNEREKYKVTSAIVKFFFHEPSESMQSGEDKIKVGGILYPSVKIGETAYNLAFNNEVAKDFLVVADVYSGRITDFSSGGYKVNLEHRLCRTGYNGSFVWEPLDDIL